MDGTTRPWARVAVRTNLATAVYVPGILGPRVHGLIVVVARALVVV